MEAYRDQYAKVFNNGRNVVVVGISVDPDTALASWARDLDTPVVFASDVGQTIGKRYGSTRGGVDNRNLFVVDPSGRIAHRMIPFNELSQAAYDELEQAVGKTLPAR
jgi:thioredoxin-dependent peroxiredoxin